MFVICALACPVACLGAPAVDPAAEETKIGKREADQFAADKTTKFITDPAMVDRVQTIGNAIAKVANTKTVPALYGKSTVYKFNYTFKIVDDKDINAFSLPGGFIYVNKGLLDYVQSDDELAGVLAHECSHAAHHHAMQLMATQNKQMIGLAGVLLASALGGVRQGSGLVGIGLVGQLINQAKTSSYGQQAETDADLTGIEYLTETKYNPVGMLTFMERLARDENRKPEVIYGIYATHPPSQERATAMVAAIQKLGLPINPRLVTSYLKVQVKPVANSTAFSLCIADIEIIRLTDADGRKANERADSIAKQLRGVLLDDARYHDVKIGADGRSVVILDETIIAPTQSDADLAGSTIPALAKASADHIKDALMRELLEQAY